MNARSHISRTTDFGDSVIELTLPALKLRQAYTPTNQAQLNSSDTDLGSGSPALLGGHLAWIAGKDGIQRVLNLSALDGSAPGAPAILTRGPPRAIQYALASCPNPWRASPTCLVTSARRVLWTEAWLWAAPRAVQVADRVG